MKWNATGLLYPSQLCFLLCRKKIVLLSCTKLKKEKEKKEDEKEDKDEDEENEERARER